jgi:hypothetical protein
MATSGLKETSKKAPAPRAELENGHGNGQFSRRHRASELQEKRVLIAFDYEDERYEALYNKRAITIEFGQSLQELEEAADAERIIATLAGLLLDWDLVRDDETPLPCSVEEIRRQPTEYLIALINAIWLDYRGPLPPTPSETP